MRKVVMALLLFNFGCTWMNQKLGLSDDNTAEEIGEFVTESAIEYEIGVRPHLDFTPATPEKN